MYENEIVYDFASFHLNSLLAKSFMPNEGCEIEFPMICVVCAMADWCNFSIQQANLFGSISYSGLVRFCYL